MHPVDIKGLLKSIGVSYVRTIKPFNIKASMAAIKEAIRVGNGVRVIIAEEECALQYGRRVARTPPRPCVKPGAGLGALRGAKRRSNALGPAP